MKVIFLDIDGVISLSGDISKRTVIREGLTVPYRWNEECCYALHKILSNNDAEIVLSSDWRKHYRLPEMREILGDHSILGDYLIGYTPVNPKYTYAREFNSQGLYRSEEINEYLSLHGIKEWVAIDDLNLSGLDKKRFVKTDSQKGILGNGIVERINNILNGEL